MSKIKVSLLLVAAVAAISVANGQTVTFTYQGVNDPSPVPLVSGNSIAFPSTQIGSSVSGRLTLTNPTQATIQVTTAATANSAVFGVTPANASLNPGQSIPFNLTFTPKVAGYIDTGLTIVTADGSKYVFSLSGSGLVVSYVTSYILNPTGNQTPVNDGGTIAFGATQVSQATTATFIINNAGTGPGTINSVNITGAAFKVTGLPLLPYQLPAGISAQFTVSFTPTESGPATGSLQVTLGGNPININLSGIGSSATFTYQAISDSGSTAVVPNGTVSFADTPLNTTSTLAFQVTNSGNAVGTLGSITILGTSFQLANLPNLPAVLQPGASAIFSINFTPTAPGTLTAKLSIDGITFTLSGNGTGPRLIYTFVIGASTTTLQNGSVISFPNTPAGTVATGSLNIQNTGNQPALVNSVSIAAIYFGINIPTLPYPIAPGETLSMALTFVPNALGTLTGTLGVDSVQFNLRGIATAPPTLPAYSYTGVGGTAGPSTQPAIGLSLNTTYPTDITGTLTITFLPSSFVDDPAIQFATGGRVLPFRIAANTSAAIFGNGASSVPFQTGTVAGNIIFTPAFTTGSVSITPTQPLTQQVTVAASAPVIRNVQIGTQTATSFEVLITGYSTPRAVTQVTLNFTAASGANLQTTTLSVNSDSAFSSWYQSTPGILAGSQFTASVTVSVNGSASAVQTVAATLTNSSGTSNSMSANLH